MRYVRLSRTTDTFSRTFMMIYMNLDDFFIKMIDKALQSVLSSTKNRLQFYQIALIK